MTPEEEPVRLVLLGDAAGAPVCDDEVCYLPDSTVDVVAGATEPGPADPATGAQLDR